MPSNHPMLHPKNHWGSGCTLASCPWWFASHKLVLQLARDTLVCAILAAVRIQLGTQRYITQSAVWNPVPYQGCHVLHCGAGWAWWFIWTTTNSWQRGVHCIWRRIWRLFLLLRIFTGGRWICRQVSGTSWDNCQRLCEAPFSRRGEGCGYGSGITWLWGWGLFTLYEIVAGAGSFGWAYGTGSSSVVLRMSTRISRSQTEKLETCGVTLLPLYMQCTVCINMYVCS